MFSSIYFMGIEVFVSHRGIPSVFWVDNGTPFSASDENVLQRIRE